MDATATTVAQSNSLADLAARIKAEHEATSTALKSSITHGIAAGELLVEAKAKVPHGQWLPWLKDNCEISERTAQLYMRLAKNRGSIEDQIRNGIADLSLNEAAALLMLSSDARRLIAFVRDCENLHGDELIERCIAEGVTVIQTPGYDPLSGRSEAEKLGWHLFMMFLSFDEAANRAGGEPEGVSAHVEWILQRPFQNVAEWLGPEGDKFRQRCGMRAVSDSCKTSWAAFRDLHRDWTLPDAIKKLESLQSEFIAARARLKPQRQGRRRSMMRASGCR